MLRVGLSCEPGTPRPGPGRARLTEGHTQRLTTARVATAAFGRLDWRWWLIDHDVALGSGRLLVQTRWKAAPLRCGLGGYSLNSRCVTKLHRTT